MAAQARPLGRAGDAEQIDPARRSIRRYRPPHDRALIEELLDAALGAFGAQPPTVAFLAWSTASGRH